MTDMTHEEAMKRIAEIENWEIGGFKQSEIDWLCSYARTAYVRGMEGAIQDAEWFKGGLIPNNERTMTAERIATRIRARIAELQPKQENQT